MKKWFACLVLLLSLGSSVFAADPYILDPKHSSVNFCVKHMVLSTVCGRFKQFEATINLDSADITKSSWSGTIKTASITTDQDGRDADLKSPNFFDVVKYPDITFKSTKIEKAKDGYVAVGTFTIKGVSKEIQIPFTLTGPVKIGPQTKIGISAALTINRMDYGITWNKKIDSGGLVVSEDVKINLEAEGLLNK